MRTVYLIAYDIAHPRRLARVHKFLLAYKVGGQKSVYECWLTPRELAEVRRGLEVLMEPTEDRVHFFQLEPRMTMRAFGKARSFVPGYFTIL